MNQLPTEKAKNRPSVTTGEQVELDFTAQTERRRAFAAPVYFDAALG